LERQQAEEAHATVLPNGTGDDTVRKRGYSKVKSPIAALDGKVRLQNSNREGDLLTMKKTIAAVSLIIALVMAGPVAAAGIDFGGSIETNIEVNRSVEGEVDVNPASELSLNLGLTAAQDKLRAGVQFGLSDEYTQLMPTGITLGDIALKQAFIEADGAYWHGGPEVTTRFGTLDVAYSPYATVKDHSGVSISGMDLDVVDLSAFYGLPTDHGHVLGMRADINVIDEVDLGASVIADEEILRVQLDAAGSPMEGLRLAGAIAADHVEGTSLKDINNLWTVQADYELLENTTVTAGYKFISDDWAPRYVAPRSKDDDQVQDWVHQERNRNHGVFVGVSTEQQGISVAAEYDQVFAHAALSAGTEYEGFKFDVATVLDVPGLGQMSTEKTTFGVGRDFDVMEGLTIAASYEGEWVPAAQQLTHTIGASTTLGLIPAIDGLSINGEISASELNLQTMGYKIGAEFEAPNGVNLGIEHDRFEGTTFQAGMKVEF